MRRKFVEIMSKPEEPDDPQARQAEEAARLRERADRMKREAERLQAEADSVRRLAEAMSTERDTSRTANTRAAPPRGEPSKRGSFPARRPGLEKPIRVRGLGDQ
jgi:hypothetical protein